LGRSQNNLSSIDDVFFLTRLHFHPLFSNSPTYPLYVPNGAGEKRNVRFRSEASKRIALKPGTWATHSQLRKPDQTFDDTIAEMIMEHQRKKLIDDLDDIDNTEKTFPWNRTKKDLV